MHSFDYANNKRLDHEMGKAAWTMPSTIYIALLTSAPIRTQTGSTIPEVTTGAYGSYARKALAAADLGSASSGLMQNSAAQVFATPTSGSGTAKYIAILDAATLGNAIRWAPICGSNTLKDITSITKSGTTATVTCPSHGYSSSDEVDITGATDALYNGNFVITVVDANTFTYTMTSTPAANAVPEFAALRAQKIVGAAWSTTPLVIPQIAISALSLYSR